MNDMVRRLPKTELHLHIEGTLEPEAMLQLAERNRVRLPYADVDELRRAYRFVDLQSFLDVYYVGASVLRTEQDFADLMSGYLTRAYADGVRHAEIFFDPQTHTERGIEFPVFMDGFRHAMADARRRLGITSDLILCFLRHLPAEAAMRTLEQAESHLDGVIGVGLDSSEVGNPPQRFADAFARARALGLRAVAHAGEEGPPSYITGALDVLRVERIDHGIRCLEDEALVERLRRQRIPLTVCPLSNVALKVVDRLEDHPLPELLTRGLLVTVNSDDPAYFGGYVGDNYARLAQVGMSHDQLVTLAANSIEASFLPAERKRALADELTTVARQAPPAPA